MLAPPLSPESLGAELSLSQVVTGEYEDSSHSLRVETEITPERLVMVGLSAAGAPLFTLELEDGQLTTDALTSASLPFDPQYILSDFQLAHWPAEILMRRVAESGYRFEDDRSQGERRVYAPTGDLVILVDYTQNAPGELVIEHYDPPYSLHVRTIGQGAQE